MEILKDTISLKEFNEYNLNESVNVDPIVRLEYYMANLCSILANVNRDPKKRQNPYMLDDFLLFNEVDHDEKNGMSKGELLSMRTHIGMIIKGAEKNQNKSKKKINSVGI